MSGEFANRFGRAATRGNQPGSNPLPQDFTQAAGEIKTAEDILVCLDFKNADATKNTPLTGKSE
ncbi:MAG: hypothetical protein AAFY16_02890 [Cyanobacteria bacterium J06642_3]